VEEEWHRDHIVSGLSSGEGLIWAVRDPITKTKPIRDDDGIIVDYEEEITDRGVEDKRLLVIEPEFASTLKVLGREGSTLSPLIRQAWDSGDLRSLTKNSPAKATGAHISIITHVTRDELRRCLNSTEAGNGFANRFLWVCVRRSKLLPEGGRLHEVDLGPLRHRLTEAASFATKVTRLHRDEPARQAWQRIYPELSEGQRGLLGAVTSRAEAQVTRLSTLYALLDCSSIISKEHLRAALALWEYVESSARFIFGDSLGDPIADEVLGALRNQPKGLTRTEIRDLFGRHKGAVTIGTALSTLAEHGLASSIEEKTSGRSIERWYSARHLPTIDLTVATEKTR
jgi:hypothetical protein